MSFTCFLNLRIKGTIIYSKCIFDTKSCDNIYSQLSKLGLIIHNTPLWSFWICHKCCSVITRLQRDTEIFQKWKNEETTETTKTCQGEDTSSTDKRDRDPTPSKTPRLIKKSRKSTEMPLRSSVTEVLINYDLTKKTLTCQSDIAGIVESLAKMNFSRASNLISRNTELMDHLEASVLDIVEADCVTLCNEQNQFMLWRSSALDLQSFSFQELHDDLKRLSPFLFSILSKITKDYPSHLCCSLSGFERKRTPFISPIILHQFCINVWRGKKSCFPATGQTGHLYITFTCSWQTERNGPTLYASGDVLKTGLGDFPESAKDR
ncbi:uncharacterized protein LOC124466323 [Hypomesus transpacificus]|uniref:uncharacterized protein LOC124466323 n=1 Tax=Hypomesus transpacificus TaxID=137520 RepID=UPI001F07A6DE|nr:uncharacterized protein LOC124466323 [Hypomesus transpacificus]